jgi:hypothetical protein
MPHRNSALVLAVLVFGAGWCRSAEQHLVLPSAFANIEGPINTNIPIGAVLGTMQSMYSASEMAAVPIGSRITGFQTRQENLIEFGAWPRVSLAIANYRVFMGTSTLTPATFSNTFAANIVDKQAVRSGALPLAMNAYPGGLPIGGTVPKGWGPVIVFDQPHVYDGGPLVIKWRGSGADADGGTSGDAAFNSSAAAGGGNATSTEATGSNGGGVAIIRLTYLPPGCAGDLNNDGFVDDSDFVLFANAYNLLLCSDPAMPAGCPADLTADAFVDDADFVIFAEAYNQLICP